MRDLTQISCLTLLILAFCQATDRFYTLKEQNKKLITEAIAKYSEASENVVKRENAIVETTKNIQTTMEKTKSALPEDLKWDRFYKGYKNMTLAADFFRTIDSFVTDVIDDAQRRMGSFGTEMFLACYNKEVANVLKQIIDALPQKLAKLNEGEAMFKKQLERCSLASVIRAETTNSCIEVALKEVPYPTMPQTGVQTVQSMQKFMKCLAFASEATIVESDTGIKVYKKNFKKYQNLIVDKYDYDGTPEIKFTPIEKLLPISEDILIKLETVRVKVEAAKLIQKQAAGVNSITVEDANEALKSQVKDLADFISQTQEFTSPDEKNCYSTANDSLNAFLKKRSGDLVNCITTSGILPSAIGIATVDNIFKDTESKQYTLNSAVECSKNLRNIFYPNRMDPCLATAAEDTLLQLSTLQLLMENAAEDAANFLVLAKRCKCNIETKLRREARDVFYTLQTCQYNATKLRFEIPQQPCVLSACA